MSTISLLAASMESVAYSLDDPVNVDELLYLICLAAVDAVPGAEYAGITVADRDGGLETTGATHPVVHRLDALQYEFNEGPGVDALGVAGRPVRMTCAATCAGRDTGHRPSSWGSAPSSESSCSTNPA